MFSFKHQHRHTPTTIALTFDTRWLIQELSNQGDAFHDLHFDRQILFACNLRVSITAVGSLRLSHCGGTDHDVAIIPELSSMLIPGTLITHVSFLWFSYFYAHNHSPLSLYLLIVVCDIPLIILVHHFHSPLASFPSVACCRHHIPIRLTLACTLRPVTYATYVQH
jgi:hypothetical protein